MSKVKDQSLEEIENKVLEYLPQANIVLIEHAYEFAKKAHEGQKRLSGEPYFNHALETAKNIIGLKLDETTIAVGLLHDVAEDTPVSLAEVRKEFGDEIAFLLRGITKVGQVKLRGEREEDILENLRQLFLVMAEDLRVVFVKLCDRLHNVQTLKFLPREKQVRVAKETIEIYAPLAGRLGIGELKGQLEDNSFPFAKPSEYAWVKKVSEKKYQELEGYLEKAKEILLENLRENNIEAEVHGRKKHFYSLYKKLLLNERDIGRIYDLVALRIIVNDLSQCYAVLGLIHKLWKPLKGRIKDYIAQPKPSGYQSLHTTVFGPDGRIFEIQIRTKEMHDFAEHGAAAHWHYTKRKEQARTEERLKRGVGGAVKNGLEFAWVKELVTWQNHLKSPDEYRTLLKNDFLAGRIYVFTPKGDVIDLAQGATTLDFAYSIHSGLGNSCAGAKVNGKLVSLDTKLDNADMVEIIKAKTPIGPKRDWLDLVVTEEAKRRIRSELRKNQISNIKDQKHT